MSNVLFMQYNFCFGIWVLRICTHGASLSWWLTIFRKEGRWKKASYWQHPGCLRSVIILSLA